MKKTLTLKRNIDQLGIEIQEKLNTVCNDSVQHNKAGTSLISGISLSRNNDGKWTFNLRWEVRPDWKMRAADCIPGNVLSFDVYETTSHKYWLKRIVRMCR